MTYKVQPLKCRTSAGTSFPILTEKLVLGLIF